MGWGAIEAEIQALRSSCGSGFRESLIYLLFVIPAKAVTEGNPAGESIRISKMGPRLRGGDGVNQTFLSLNGTYLTS